MAKQLLIYDNIVVLSSEQHGNWCFKNKNDFQFAQGSNAFPVLNVEFFQAASIYPIVFIKTEAGVYPSVIVGIQDEQNLFVNESGEWDADYVPAFLRRYPYVYSLSEDKKNLTVCLDDQFDGWNQDGLGERLFDSEGQQTQYLSNVVKFLQDYHSNYLQTEAFCQKLEELDLLENMQANVTVEGVEQLPIQGFFGVNRQKLMNLSQEDAHELLKNGGLELIYLHIHSLNRFSDLAKRASKAAPSEAPEASES